MIQRRVSLTVVLCAVVSLLASPAHGQVDDCCTNIAWVQAPRVWNNPLKVCQSDGYFLGTFCFPFGIGYSCGTQTTITRGTEASLTGGFEIEGVSAEASITHSFSQAFTHTAGNCERCQIYIRYVNSTLRPWSCECFLSFWSWDCSVDLFAPANAPPPGALPCCEVDNSCPGCPQLQPPGGDPDLASAPTLPVESAAGDPVPSTMTINLDTFFTVVRGEPWPYHPINEPSFSFDDLTSWHRCQILRAVRDIEEAEPVTITEVTIVDADGQHHHLPVEPATDPIPCGCGPWDLFRDGNVDPLDLAILMSMWGPCAGCPADFNDDGVVDDADTAELLAHWGTC